MKIPARLFIFVISLFIIHYSLFISPVSAQTTNPNTTSNTNPDTPNNLPAGRQDLHTWTQNVMIEVMAAATCQLAGVDPVNPNQKCLGVNPKTNSIGFVEGGGGAIGLMGNLIALTYTPPLHTGDYFSYLAQNFGIVKPAYAQGVGFQGLEPLMKLWIAFRNIVYLAFVVVFVVVGVAIMLRVKIDPRTVMTIENQIPKIIVGLFLVTFSFAIAGFLIDLMWLSTYLVANVITQTLDPKIASDLGKITQSTHPLDAANIIGGAGGKFGGLGGIGKSVADSVASFFAPIFDNNTGRLVVALITTILGKIGGAELIKDLIGGLITASVPLLGPAGPPVLAAYTAAAITGLVDKIIMVILAVLGGAFAPQIVGIISGFIAFIIIMIALLWALFRLWFELLKAYIFILLDVVLAPFFVVLGLFPGSPIGFGAWLRDILANLSAFPVTIAMFLLGRVFMEAFSKNEPNQFAPPLIGNPADTSAFGALIGFGIILMTPQVVNMMKEVFKAPQLKYTAGIGQAMGVGTGVVQAPFRPLITGVTFLGGQRWAQKIFPFLGGGSPPRH